MAGLAVVALTLLAGAPTLEACAASAANASTATVCTFQPAVNYGTGSLPVSVAVGDFNGDGKQDLASANQSGTVSILLGNGDGTFQPPVDFAVGTNPRSVAVGDFNGDGMQDLAVVNYGPQGVSILLGNGNGTFQPAVNYGVGTGSTAVVVADFNRDGKPDLAVVTGSSSVAILLGNGNGTFQAAVSYPVPYPRSVAVGDFNGDGKPDLATGNGIDATISILLGNGDGTFAAALSRAVVADPISVVVADFNGDGKQDLAVAYDHSSGLDIFPGNGNGTFGAPATSDTGQYFFSMALGDFNADGKPDLVTANRDFNRVGVLLGSGNGALQPVVLYPTGSGPLSVAVGDFNGDGHPDLATANVGSDNVSILLNLCRFVTTTGIGSSSNPSFVGQPVTFTANVTSGGAGIPTGTVTFKDGTVSGTTVLGTGTLAGGTATFTTSALTVLTHRITAVYAGDGAFAGSTSPVLTQTVNLPPGDLSITVSDGQALAVPGSPITYTIVASNTGPNPVTGALVEDYLHSYSFAASPTWTCVGASGGTCTASGVGAVFDPVVNLPVGGTATYALTGTLSANPLPLTNTAVIYPPFGMTDPDYSNNSATDIDSLNCRAETIVVPDGRVTASTTTGGATSWLAASLQGGNSYSVEFKNETESSVPPGVLTAFRGDDGCSDTSTLTATDTTIAEPGSTPGSVRMSFTATGTTPLYQFRLVNGGADLAYTVSVSDTTMYSPAWSTNGSFNTFYSFQNTTGTPLNGTLTLLDTAGATLGTFPLAIPAGQTASTNTMALSVARSKTGTARFTHDGPPGAIVAEAAIANFTISPAYVQPVKFQATREAR